jgi:cation:H+ antiporter
MVLNVVLLLAGFVTLIKGADFMVAGASSIARRMKVSMLIIGLTIVAFGTSAPELTVNIINSYNGRNEAIFGNVIGSNIFNLLFILGFTGTIYPLVVQKKSVKYEVPISLVAVFILWALVNDVKLKGAEQDILTRLDAILLLVGFLFFMYYIYRSMQEQSDSEENIKEYTVFISIVMIISGIAMLIGGGYLVTENAVGIAQKFGLSDKLIGLTILAVGTSLPELATSVVAAYKRSTDIAIGNVIGSNIFNFFFIMGINGLIKPVAYISVLNTDMYVLVAGTVVLLITMFTLSRNKLDRWEAVILLMSYFGYTCYLIIRN